MDRYNIDLIALQEARWRGNGIFDSGRYTMFYSGGQTAMRGTGFLINQKIKGLVLDFSAVSDRICTVRIKGSFFNTTIISAYAPTEDTEEEEKDVFYEILEQTYDKLPRNDIKIIMGDMNAKVGQENVFKPAIGAHSLHEISNDNGGRLIDFALSKSMIISSTCFQHKKIHKMTWRSPDNRTRNQIDHVLIDKRHATDILDVRSLKGADCDTDHFLVYVKYRQRLSTIRGKKAQKMKKFDIEQLKDSSHRIDYQTRISELLTNEPLEPLENNITIQNRWSRIKQAVITAAEEKLGYAKKRHREEWFDQECQEAVRERNVTRCKMLDRVTRSNTNEYKEKRRKAKKVLRQKKRLEAQKKMREIEELAENKEIRKMYKEVGDLKRGFQPRTTLCKNQRGELTTNPAEAMDVWVNYFKILLNPTALANKTLDGMEDDDGRTVPEPDYQEFQRAIKELRNNKAPGTDLITAELLKNGGTDLQLEIYMLQKKVWQMEEMPDEWNMAIIQPIHKKGDKWNCSNYRGISLLNTAYKILSKIISYRLHPYVNQIVGNYQSGFRQGKSTIDQIFMMRNILEKCYEYNVTLHQLFIDFKKAYDSVDRNNLYAIMEEFEIPKKIIRLTQMTLNHTVAKVKIQNELSEPFEINTGLRQGDIISTQLFNICLEKVIRQLQINPGGTIHNRSSQILAYADDIAIISRNGSDLEEKFIQLETAAKETGLNVNQEKTKYMINTKDENRFINIKNFKTGDQKFDRIEQFKYLGSHITSRNENTTEIQARLAAANRSYYALGKLLKSSLITRKTKLRMYKTIIRPVAMYGAETWVLTQDNVNILNRWERKILRKIYGPIQYQGEWRIRWNHELYQIYDQPTIVTEIKRARIRWLGHVLRMGEEEIVRKVYEGNPGGKRRRGRPRKRWKDDVENDLKKMKVNNYKEKAKDRSEWRKVVEEARALQGL